MKERKISGKGKKETRKMNEKVKIKQEKNENGRKS